MSSRPGSPTTRTSFAEGRVSRFADPESARLTGRLSATGKRTVTVGTSPRSSRSSAAVSTTVSPRLNHKTHLSMPQNPTSEQKHRLIFDALDLKQTQNLAATGFHRTFKTLNLNFSAQTVDELYRHMDLNHDGVISFSEFLNWTANYPFLIDAIYGRLRETHERKDRLEELETQKRLLDDAQREERLRNENATRGNEELDKQLTYISALQQELNKRAEQLKQANQNVFEANRCCDDASNKRTNQERELTAAKQVEKEAHKPVREAADEQSRVEELLETRNHELRKAEDHVKKCEIQLTEARREQDRCLTQNEEAQNELDFIKDCEATVFSILEDAKANVRQQEKELHEAELVVLRRHDDLRDIEDKRRETEEAAQMVVGKREDEECRIQDLREASDESARHHKHAIQHVDEAYQKMINLESNLASYLAERQRLEEAEQRYLDEEVGLREVRVRLEQRSKDLTVTGANTNRSRSLTFEPAGRGSNRHTAGFSRKSVM